MADELFALTSTPTVDPFFTTFWANYPKKAAKVDAQKAWRQAHVDAPLMTKILTALTNQATERHWRIVHGLWVPEIPLPATWIRGKRWDDEVIIMRMAAASPDYLKRVDDLRALKKRDA